LIRGLTNMMFPQSGFHITTTPSYGHFNFDLKILLDETFYASPKKILEICKTFNSKTFPKKL
jgi:hypothetical protein